MKRKQVEIQIASYHAALGRFVPGDELETLAKLAVKPHVVEVVPVVRVNEKSSFGALWQLVFNDFSSALSWALLGEHEVNDQKVLPVRIRSLSRKEYKRLSNKDNALQTPEKAKK